MTLRAGSADMSRPRWKGMIRNDGYPWYVCTHEHGLDYRAAKACSKAALPALKLRDPDDPDAPLPEGWTVYQRGTH